MHTTQHDAHNSTNTHTYTYNTQAHTTCARSQPTLPCASCRVFYELLTRQTNARTRAQVEKEQLAELEREARPGVGSYAPKLGLEEEQVGGAPSGGGAGWRRFHSG